ncbi:unnamed protein product [Allacma fusca]|uniref:Uncharacterized protein n=1 Tax=Allacma fusca TaxID=39272 RepID=A0A8J2PCN9_9HEXA|nr:unnamed protein product [Allacma fusca]
MTAESFVAELKHLCLDVNPRMPDADIIERTRGKLPSRKESLVITPSRTLQESVKNISGLLRDPEMNPSARTRATISSVSQAPQMVDNSVRVNTSQMCDYCNRNNHLWKQCRDLQRDLDAGNTSKLISMMETRNGRVNRNNNNVNNFVPGANGFVAGQQQLRPPSQFQQHQQPSRQNSNWNVPNNNGQQYFPNSQDLMQFDDCPPPSQQWNNPPQGGNSQHLPNYQAPRNYPRQDNYQGQQQSHYHNQQQSYYPQGPRAQYSSAPQLHNSGLCPPWNDRGYRNAQQQQFAGPIPASQPQGHPDVPVNPGNCQVWRSGRPDQPASFHVLHNNEDVIIDMPDELSDPPIILPPARAKKKGRFKDEIPRSLPQVDCNEGSKSPNLINKYYLKSRKRHRLTLRATVDTGSMISTMSAATASYLTKYCPQSIKIINHDPDFYYNL